MTIGRFTVARMLTEGFMRPRRMTRAQLAEALGVPRRHAAALCRGEERLTNETAAKLGEIFGTGAQFWIDLQNAEDGQAPAPFIRVVRCRTAPAATAGDLMRRAREILPARAVGAA